MTKCETLENENKLLKEKINKMEIEQIGMINLLNSIRNKLNI
jgi:hypothetical protein